MNLFFRRSFLLTICVTLLGFVPPFYAFADSIIVKANPGYYPVTYKEGNHWYGMDTEVLQEIFARADLSYDVVFKPFKRSLIEMERGEIHVIPNLTKSNVRSKYALAKPNPNDMYWFGCERSRRIPSDQSIG
ncbi:hypothetical protein A3749_26395 [Oleiphilus sp. HI0078]|nr:hypothetical protein A3749_26395 [Oleiphilus sp. HI0078]KZZ47386.1 hypothetical protein A3755_15815 [Oleiphilus sp. HI0085]